MSEQKYNIKNKEESTQDSVNVSNRISTAQAEALALINGMMSKDAEEHNVKKELESKVEGMRDSIKSSPCLNDAYGNLLTGTGTEDKTLSFTKYILSNDTLNFPLWLTLYNDSWVFRRAIDKPATDEIRCGITITNKSLTDEQKEAALNWYNLYSNNLIELLQWGALFGGAIAVCLFDSFKDEDYKKSITQNISKLKSSKTMRMYVVDRWYGVAPSSINVKSMKSLDFGKPIYYDITFADGVTKRIHHDYILRFENRTAPRLIKNGPLQGWGYAEGAHIIQELIRDDQLKSAVLSLVNKSLIEVIKMSGMRGLFMGTDASNAEQLNKRLEMVNWARNFNSLTFLDKDDDYTMNQFSGVSGLADLMEQNMWLIAAALEMEGVLFGELKGGLASDSQAIENYSNTINNRCKMMVQPVIQKFLSIFYQMKGITVKPIFEFNLLARKKEDKDKMDAMKNFADILSQLLADGVIDTKKYAQCIQNYTSKGIVSITFTEEELKDLETNFDEEMEAIEEEDIPETIEETKPLEEKGESKSSELPRTIQK